MLSRGLKSIKNYGYAFAQRNSWSMYSNLSGSAKGTNVPNICENYNKCMELMTGLALILMKPNLIDTRNLQFFLLVRESHQMSEAISVARFGYR